jgi:hypothetical protein
MIIKGDSTEYHLLTKHIGKLKIDRATLTCEIGLREGGMARGGGAAIKGTDFKGVF